MALNATASRAQTAPLRSLGVTLANDLGATFYGIHGDLATSMSVWSLGVCESENHKAYPMPEGSALCAIAQLARICGLL